MVAQLRAKSGAADVEVTIGDFSTTKLGATFRLAYLVYNTITNLTTQDEQVESASATPPTISSCVGKLVIVL